MQPLFRRGPWRRQFRSDATTVVILISLAACQSDSNPVGAPFQRNPTIGIQLSSGALSVRQGERVSIAVTVSRSGGYTGAIALEVDGEPDGITPIFDAPVVLMGSSTSTLTLEARDTMEPGTYPLTLCANGSGVEEKSASLVLTVLPASTPSIRISLAAGTVWITRGLTGSVGVFVFRIGEYTGPVSLAVSGAPDGVTTMFAPAPVLPGTESSTMTYVTAATTVAGAYTVTVTASGPGVASYSALLRLNVTDPVPPAIAVTFAPLPDFVWIVQGDITTPLEGVNVTRYGGYTGLVELSLEGLPSDIEGTFSPNPLDANTSSSVITLTTVPSVGLGSYDVTIRARGAGVPDATSVFRLVVFPAGPRAD